MIGAQTAHRRGAAKLTGFLFHHLQDGQDDARQGGQGQKAQEDGYQRRMMEAQEGGVPAGNSISESGSSFKTRLN